MCIYADLDSLIERSGLSPMERKTVMYLMKGYSIPDIAFHFGKIRGTCENLFKRAVRKIVRQNNIDWEKWSGGRINDN